MAFEPVLSRNFNVSGAHRLEVYRQRGGYRALTKGLEMGRTAVAEQVQKASLRGRGGAGFPAAMKWSFLPADRKVTYLCVNADESEPGTFNNRYIMELDPHLLLEGILLAGFATLASVAYIYIRAEYHKAYRILQGALDEAYAAGLFGKNIQGKDDFSMECYIHRGAGAYVCGEETGLMESLEGKRGWPRIKPPFPAVAGLFGKPTVVNNVETLACVVPIIEHGAAWFVAMGAGTASTGSKLYTISGPVKRPGCYEAPLGLTVRDLVYGPEFGQGMIEGATLKAVVPGGLSVGFLTADELDCKLDFDDPRKYGLLGLGTAGAMVIDDRTDLRDVLVNITRFYSTESCGQCTQCREGTTWMYKIARRMAAGAGRMEDLDLIIEVTATMGMMTGRSICGHSDGAAYPIRTLIQKFRNEFEEHIRNQKAVAATAV